MKIVWHSVSPWVGSGYGQQTALFTPRIRDLGHDVALSAYYGLMGSIGNWNGMTMYPGDHTPVGKFMLRTYVEDHAQGGTLDDVQVITLMDVWPWISMRHGGDAAFDGLRIAAWCPVDHAPVPPAVVRALDEHHAQPIAMSRFGEEQLRTMGFDPFYVPHGIDTSIFRPATPEQRAETRRSCGIPEDAFVVGMVANNQGDAPPRKAFPQVIAAFAELRRHHPDALLYLHCEATGLNGGIDLTHIINLCDIPHDAVALVDQAKYMAGTITQSQMSRIYSMFDVLANPSYGEGFGVPIIEAQACGTPVVVTDWTAMPELCGAGWKVTGDPWYDAQHGSWFMCPEIQQVYGAFEAAYEQRGNQGLRDQACEFAQEYDAALVTERYWKPVLEQLENGRTPPAAVPLNRAQRRAQAKVAA